MIRFRTHDTLEPLLLSRSSEAAPSLARPVEGKPEWVQCLACGHACRIPPGRPGICKVRMNVGGRLRVPMDYVANLAVDPIEKKPFFHVVPGSNALSFGMLGCDLHCPYCQNWFTSQALRDAAAISPPQDISAEGLVENGVHTGCRSVISTYNEPLITTEWAHRVFSLARSRGFLTGYVSNGNATPEVLDYLRPVTDLYKVDLKGFDDRAYRRLGTVLSRVLSTLEALKTRGYWVEVVTLLVPGLNDSESEIRALTRWLASLDPLTPWHVTAFHADYRMGTTPSTSPEALLRAAEIGVASGLKYVYCGNRTGRVGSWEDTRCHGCETTLVRRAGFRILESRMDASGTCPACRTRIPGVWE